jgi:hypothetical protein
MELRYPWPSEQLPAEELSPQPEITTLQKARGRRPNKAAQSSPSSAAAPDWLYHHVTVSGPDELVTAFAAAARGSGVIPWQLDFAVIEEDVFNLAVAQPGGRSRLSIAGCRILARQFRERVEARQARAAALVGRSTACPLDLHALLPAPPAILQLGPAHPAARAWLAENWGTADHLRKVVELPRPSSGRRMRKGCAVIGYGFFTDGDTPSAAIARVGSRWPELDFSLQPRPVD